MYYHWCAANLNNSADANCGRNISGSAAYHQKCNSSQCCFVYPATASVLVAGGSRDAGQLWCCSALPGGFHPFPQDKTDGNTPNLGSAYEF